MKTIYEKLEMAGIIQRENQLKRRPLSRADRAIIERYRTEARELGLRERDIRRHEMNGEQNKWSLRDVPYEAVFLGFQEYDGFKVRLYNVVGNHPLNGSTLTLTGLVHNRIWPSKMNGPQIAYAYLAEILGTAWIKVLEVKAKVSRGVPPTLGTSSGG